MKIEKLRNNHKKEIIIGTILTVVIGGAITFRLTHSKYRVTQSIDLGAGTINLPNYKIVAMYKSDNKTNYTEITTMPSSGYIINESKSYCNQNGSKDTSAVLKTVNGSHIIETKLKADKCYLYFDKVPTASETILANLGENIKETAPDFSKIATTDEGIFKTEDGMYGGTTYYWRGAVSNNYVKFAGYCWRIIRINGDKTIRLIYDGTTCHANGTSTTDSIAVSSVAYNLGDSQSNYVGWTYSGTSQRGTSTPSNAKTQTETWYNNNLSSYATFIANGKYCNDREPASGYTWEIKPSSDFHYAAYGRLDTNKTPTFNCTNSEDVYTLKVGAITADEIAFAGGASSVKNYDYYLCNQQAYLTMSPYDMRTYPRMYAVAEDGSISATKYALTNVSYGIRPVINLKSDTTFSSGDGTQNSPYVVS